MSNPTENKWIHIQNPNFFKFKFQSIDSKTLDYLSTFKSEIKLSTHRNNFDKIITIFDFILFLNNKKLTQIHLHNTTHLNFQSLFNESFAFFISNKFYENQSKEWFIKSFYSVAELFNNKFKTNISIDKSYVFNPEMHADKIKITNGIKYGRITKYGYLNLIDYYLKTKDSEIIKIIDILDVALNKKEYGIFLSKYFKYLENNNIKFFETNDEVLTAFMLQYFEEINENNNCIYKAKARWNSLIELLTVYFDFNLNKNLKVIREQKNPHICQIKQTNGKYVKTKLISDIPLEICDDKAIYLLKSQVNQDIELINSWAEYQINKFEQDLNEYQPVDVNHLFLNKENFDSLYNKPHLLSKTVSMAIITKLIIEHPMITESFIRQLTVNSYIKLDNCSFLVGNKPRKGADLAEQKITLNEYTDKLVSKWIEWTNIFREYYYLKDKKKNESLLLSCSEYNNLIISDYQNNLVFRETIQKNISDYLVEQKNIDRVESDLFSKKITFTKIRASKAMSFYFETESTSKMAEILGHENYKPNLLSHYLPEPILQYYQTRWIRIFQKGIICEAMKDSEFLFKATNFQTTKQLDDFLTNHTIKNIPNNLDSLTSKNNEKPDDALESYDELFISINDENISAMLALKDAVESSLEKEKIKDEAFKWCEFVEKLEKEVNQNKEMFNFKKFFAKGHKNKHLYSFNKVIYA